MRTVKLMIMSSGICLTHPRAKRGYDDNNPVIEIEGVPDDVPDSAVVRAYSRGVYIPPMHAEFPLHWSRIETIGQGEIVRLKTGRPPKDAADRSVPIKITLTPEALGLIDAQGGNRSGLIEGLIREKWG